VQSNEGWTPHEKTISLQFLDDDGRFTHSPPAWPHDEYILQFPRPSYNPTKNGSSDQGSGSELSNDPGSSADSEKDYEWKRLHPKPLNSAYIGPGFYDYTTGQYVNYRLPTHQAITDSSSSSAAAASGSGDVQIPNAASESSSNGKFYPGNPGHSGYGYGYGGYPQGEQELSV
jgi:hypothetical protein